VRKLVPLLLIAAVACSDSTAPERVPTEIRIAQSSVQLNDGDTLRLAATVLDQKGEPLAALPGGAALAWSSSSPAVVAVSDGLLTALRPGMARVTAQAGSAATSVEVAVRAVPTAAVLADGDAQRATVGTALLDSLAVRVVDRHGDGVPGITVSFRSGEGAGTLSAAAATTGAGGVARTAWTLGVRSGEQSVVAEVAGLPDVRIHFRATATAGPPAELRGAGGDGQTARAGSRLADSLVVRTTDAHGNAVIGAEVAWQVTAGGGSISPARAATDSTGTARAAWVLGSVAGAQGATASIGTLRASFDATATASGDTAALGPSVASVEPAVLTPGGTATLVGGNFGATAAENVVTIAGVVATVEQASASRLTVRVPQRGLLPCDPDRAVAVAVSVGGRSGSRSHPLRVAADRSLEVGQSVTLRSRDDVRCNRLLQGGGRYLISIFNTSASVGSRSPFQIRGTTRASSTAKLAAPARIPAPRRQVLPPSLGALTQEADDGHLAILESSRRVVESLGPRVRRGTGSVRSRLAAATPRVGDTLSFHIPKLESSSLCANFSDVRARVVYVGPRAVVVEDVAAPLAGQTDSIYDAVGREYDASMHDVVVRNFGDPLAMDGQTDANGRIFMLFSPTVNDSERSVAGFVFSGDLFSSAQCAGSNQAEIFYARVPTTLENGFSSRTPQGWLRSMRATVIHEVKHLASFAERVAAGARTLEESWLEESTARMSEELWARSLFGYGQRENVGYRESLYCEVRPSTPACTGSPLVMLDHFNGLYGYADAGGSLTPLGRTRSSDFSFYGSGWSLVRWAIDHSSGTESAFLRALTRESNLSGIRNLEARSGRSFADMLADWSLALAADDRGFTPARSQLTFPSWNLRDIFGGMNDDFPNSWTKADPLPARRVDAAGFFVEVPELRGGAAVVFELSGAAAEIPVLEVRGSESAPAAAAIGVSIVRIQ
jgi:hypothetical protein